MPDPPVLTKRQIEILRLLAKGLTSRDIAKALGLSVSTVYKHKGLLYRRLEVGTAASAVAKAARLSLI